MRHLAPLFLSLVVSLAYAETDSTTITPSEESPFTQSYLKTVESFANADKAVIYLLSHETKPVEPSPQWHTSLADDEFPLRATNQKAKTLKSREFTGQELADLMTYFREAKVEPIGTKTTHAATPVHAVRFYQGETILFETSICWMCRLASLPSPDQAHGWTTFYNRDLKKFFMREMPIPRAVIEEFATKMGK